MEKAINRQSLKQKFSSYLHHPGSLLVLLLTILAAAFTVGILIFLVVLGVVFSRFLTPYVFDALILVVSVMASIEISNCLNKIGKGAFPVASGLFGFFSYVLFFVPYILKASWWWFLILQIDLFL